MIFVSLMRDLVRKLDILFTLSPAREERIRQSRVNLLEDINGMLMSLPFFRPHPLYPGESLKRNNHWSFRICV